MARARGVRWGVCRVVGEAAHPRERPVVAALARVRADAEELAHEAQRLDRVLLVEVRLADRQELAEQDRVAAVSGALEPGHGRAHEPAVEVRREGRPPLGGLRVEEPGVVGLVPDGPQVDAGEVPAGGFGEAPEPGGAGAVDSEAVAAVRGGPARRRRAQGDHHPEAARLRGADQAVVGRPVVGRGIATVEALGPRLVAGGRRVPVELELDRVHSERAQLVERLVAHRGAALEQLAVVLEQRELPGARSGHGRQRGEHGQAQNQDSDEVTHERGTPSRPSTRQTATVAVPPRLRLPSW